MHLSRLILPVCHRRGNTPDSSFQDCRTCGCIFVSLVSVPCTTFSRSCICCPYSVLSLHISSMYSCTIRGGEKQRVKIFICSKTMAMVFLCPDQVGLGYLDRLITTHIFAVNLLLRSCSSIHHPPCTSGKSQQSCCLPLLHCVDQYGSQRPHQQ